MRPELDTPYPTHLVGWIYFPSGPIGSLDRCAGRGVSRMKHIFLTGNACSKVGGETLTFHGSNQPKLDQNILLCIACEGLGVQEL